jgi:hypothetical protein
MPEHPPKRFVAGDEWQIDASLQDCDGNPINLTNVELNWFLLDRGKHRVIDGNGVTVTVTDRQGGKCLIAVGAAITDSLSPGTYSDMLRVTLHSGPNTPPLLRTIAWEGTIQVEATQSPQSPGIEE